MTSASQPTAFVSWAHAGRGWTAQQQAAWEDTVRRFADALRNNGIDADVDLYHLHDQDVDWTRLGPNAIVAADFTLVAVSSSWIARFDGTEHPSVGAGAAREADALLSLYSSNRHDFRRRLKLVYLPDADTFSVPGTLDGVQRFPIVDVSSDGLEDLLRTLHGQPRYVPPVVGPTPAYGQAKPAAEPSEMPEDRYDVRTTRIESTFVEPPHGQPPGWATEPLLRLRVASYIAPMTSDEASPIRSGVRNRLAEALSQLELSASLTALANQLTPLSALPDGPAKPPRSLDGWELNMEAHLNADHAMLRNGGDASSGIAANFAVSLPAFTHGGQATIWIDIGLSVVEQFTVSTIARLARDCLAALPVIRDALSDVVPTRAELGRTGITLIAPRMVGSVSRPNSIEARMDFAAMGPLAHPILGDIGVSFELSSRYQSADAGQLTYLAFDRLMTDVAAIDPDDGLADLARRLGLDP